MITPARMNSCLPTGRHSGGDYKLKRISQIVYVFIKLILSRFFKNQILTNLNHHNNPRLNEFNRAGAFLSPS